MFENSTVQFSGCWLNMSFRESGSTNLRFVDRQLVENPVWLLWMSALGDMTFIFRFDILKLKHYYFPDSKSDAITSGHSNCHLLIN